MIKSTLCSVVYVRQLAKFVIMRNDQVSFSFQYLIKEQVVPSSFFFISKLCNHHALLTLQERARVSLQIYQVCDQIMILTVSCSEFRSFFTSSQHKSEVMKNMKA